MDANIQTLFSVNEVELIYKRKPNHGQQIKVQKSSQCYDIFLNYWDMNKIELLEQSMMLLLDRGNNCLGINHLSTGGVTGTIVDPKVVFATALKARASGIILAHNHPSGNLRPSNADESLTRKIAEGGRLLDISLLDHLIITPRGYYSFADEGFVPR